MDTDKKMEGFEKLEMINYLPISGARGGRGLGPWGNPQVPRLDLNQDPTANGSFSVNPLLSHVDC